MTRSCTCCTHPQRADIDRALIAGGALRNIAERFGLSTTALHRHKSDHLPPAMVKAAELEDVAHALDVVQQLRAINAASLTVLKEARAAGDGALALKAIDRIQKQIELQAKLLGELQDGATVNILVSPEWLAVRSALMTTLTRYPDARLAVVESLTALESGS
jgi:hypothetical protein